MRLLALLALLSSTALAQTEASDAGAGVLTKPPALLHQVEATFPPEMADAGVGGTVVMEVDLGPDGKVMDARVVQSAGAAFDAAALAAVKQFEFSPAEVDGQPAAVRLQYSYQFFFKPQAVQVEADAGIDDAGTPVLPVNLSGQLVERGTRIPLAGATVVVGEGEQHQEATSDDNGHFDLPRAAGAP